MRNRIRLFDPVSFTIQTIGGVDLEIIWKKDCTI